MKDKNKTKAQLIAELEAMRQRIAELEQSETEQEQAARTHRVYPRFLEHLAQIDHAIRQATDAEQMMADVLQTTLEIFEVDRAWLLYPCDPDAETWRVPMERTRPEYPGALALGEDIPMLPEVALVLREALDKDDVITVNARDASAPKETNERFSTLAEMHMAVYPTTGKPWVFGMHQCAYDRDWTDEEKNLFREIARRLGDGLSSLLSLRELRASEERWRSLTVHSPDHIMLLDCDGTIRFINYTVPDLSVEQVLGASVFNFVPENFHQAAADCHKQVIESQQPGAYETDYHTAEGEIQHFETRVAPVLDQGETVALLLNSRDITERVRAEEALRESEETYRILFETMTQGVVYQAADGQITSANPAAERVLGLTIDQMQGRASIDPRWRAIHEDGSDFLGETHPAMVSLKTGQPVHGVVMGVFHPVDEKYCWIIVDAIPQFRPGEKKPCRVYTTFSDITERMETEESLRESEAKYRHIYENVVDVIYETDYNGRFIGISPSVEAQGGYRPEEIIGRNVIDFFVYPDEYAALLLAMEPEGKVNDFVIRLRKKSGELVIVSVTAHVVFNAEGQPVKTEGILRDINTRVRMEVALRESEKKFKTLSLLKNAILESPEGIIVFALDQNYCYLDFTLSHKQTMKAIWGVDIEVGNSMLDYIKYEPDWVKAKKNFDRALKGEQFTLYEEYGSEKLKRTFYEDRYGPIFDGKGHIIGLAVYVIDITERRRAEEELRLINNQLQNSIDYMPNAYILWDQDLRVVEWNRAAEKIFGYSKEEMLGKNPVDYIVPEPARHLVGDVLRKLEIGEVTDYSEKDNNIRKDGKSISCQWFNTPLGDKDGNIFAILTLAQDVTERVQAEAGHQESNALLASVIESPDNIIIFALDTNYNYLSFNTAHIKEMKRAYDADIEIGQHTLAYIPREDDRLKAEENYKRVLKGERFIKIEEYGQANSRFWYELIFNPIFDSLHHVTGFTVFVTDITARKRAEKDLLASEDKFRVIAEQSMLGIAIIQDGYYQYVNEIMSAINEYSGDEMMSFPRHGYARMFLPEDLEFVMGQANKKQKGEKDVVTNYETRLVTKRGQIKNIEVYSRSVLFEGSPADLVTVIDISVRKQAEDELKKAQSYIINIINSMPSILVGVDFDGKITQWNNEAQRVTGLSPEKALGQPLDKAIPHLADKMERVRQAMQTREVQLDPKKVRQEDGKTLYEDVTIYPLITNSIEGAVIRVDDVTEQVRMQEMMIQSEKMLSVGGLAAGMAHEINNPLAGMMQTASVMSNRLSEDIPANLKAAEAAGVSMEAIRTFMAARGIPRMLAAINESGRRVAAIVDNMLSFARRSEAIVSTCNVADLLDKALELAATDYDLKKKYDFKIIEIMKEYEVDLPLVPCEGSKIQQVFLNILRNGAQAMHNREDQGEKLRFILQLRYEKERNVVTIRITDNGPGMDEATRKRIFEPFFTTKAVGEGTGLGLSVSYFIVTTNHGGTLDVISESDKGTTFIICLPVKGREI